MTHLTEEQFQALYDGSLDTAAEEAILHHLDRCEACLDRLNRWYEAQSDFVASNKDIQVSNTFQPRLMRRINRAEAGRALLNFGYRGLVAVFTLLANSVFTMGLQGPPRPK